MHDCSRAAGEALPEIEAAALNKLCPFSVPLLLPEGGPQRDREGGPPRRRGPRKRVQPYQGPPVGSRGAPPDRVQSPGGPPEGPPTARRGRRSAPTSFLNT
ncbi:hypothetical protein, conserved [Eimeria tenella]|uniref:Uncharacterized protein n=1 Tax=Eimeria tenella TaxID=5802 RepID=U6L6J0_EIMTE|nr:hypothetical protein, conserved [Eimeria tenella]CDJ44209.1 hypothetical protein, conserved [Eimeria tenella]|eukprot:XP_013234958.1 hypothetical protein, conserved [Eimeria tenella]